MVPQGKIFDIKTRSKLNPIKMEDVLPGLWLNLGHGSSGWALSCGSARAVADLVAGRTPEVDMEGLDFHRLR